ncbi:MAG: 2-isopropylmalate synthase [Coriobacteriales bacterium]|nr:2-isopropylmalate synthase [Coriobacteriales bacterium]
MTRKIQIFDTTLRDGEQSPGASMNPQEKLIVARQLIRLGVDVIEAGFPASSHGEFRAVEEIGSLAGDSCVVCAFARANEAEIDRAAEALKSARRPRINTGLGVSPQHLRHKLNMTEDECVQRVTQIVAYAKGRVQDVEFFAEDAGRADQEFLVRVLQAAVDAGATVINVADTCGYSLPEEWGARIAHVVSNVRGIENVTLAVHTHNDLGMATALALAGIRNGATQVECTVNGLGERAGNAALEEIAMAIRLHGEELGVHTDIRTTELTRASRLVSRVTGMSVQANKAVVGANAFAHSSGMHQDAVLKAREIYEILDPAEVGAVGSEIILSSRSGQAALRHRLNELGYCFADDEFDDVYQRFQEIAEQKKEVYDEDLESMVQERSRDVAAVYTLDALQIQCGDPLVPTAVATITDEEGNTRVVSATGTGPVDAAYKAIDRVLTVHGDLEEYAVKAITRGIDAIGEVVVRVKSADGKLYTGRGSDTDVIVSSAKAYVNAINRMITTQRSREGY